MRTLVVSLIIVFGLGGVAVLTAQAPSAEAAATAAFDPAAIMPADTKMYVELGSPGKQLETILNLLEGTGLEESLTMMLNQKRQQQKGPAGIAQAVLNPAMIEEFKKIQGAAVGITNIDVHADMPEFVAVLAPGKSDALRGILIAAIGMGGVPGEALEGMQTSVIDDCIGVAYDSSVFIVSPSPEALKDAVLRYKTGAGSASLARSQSFQKLDRARRSDNVATLWVDGQQAWGELARIMKAEGETEGLMFMNMVADPNSIQEIVVQLAIQENNIILDAGLTLNEDHQCIAYNLGRSPGLSAAGLAAVPADAFALASFSLGDADSPAAVEFQGKFQQITGLDIGRELFANIVQINVFAVEPDNVTDIQQLPVASVGISITSKSGEKTRELLDTLFHIAYQGIEASGEIEGFHPDIKPGEYNININGMTLTCYLEQQNNVTVLSPSRQIISKCFQASANPNQRAAAGLLQPVLSTLPTPANKLIVVNAGGLMRMADTVILMQHQNPFNPAHQNLKEFSRLLNGMNLCVRTSETPTRLSLNVSINNIPPLGPLFPQAMALSQCDFTAKACATHPVPCNAGGIAPNQPYTLQWQPGIGSTGHKVYFGTDTSNLSLLADLSDTAQLNGPAITEDVDTYYWRVDEIMPDGTVVPGDVWNFGRGALIARWTMDESDGTIAGDASGRHHDGILTGGQWHPSEGVYAGAIELDGTDDAVEINDFSFTTNNATFTAWIKGWKAGDWSGIVFSRTGQPCGMHFGDNNTLHYTWNNNSPKTYTWSAGPVIPQGQWAFVAVVIRPDRTIAYVYDETGGLQSAENNLPNKPQTLDNLKIGRDTEIGDRCFKGLIDDVRIYNYALSQDELKTLIAKQTANL